jgi:hypothetical protein
MSVGGFDLSLVMHALSAERPVFGSEADFQMALAWRIQAEHPSARIRLEYRPAFLDRRGFLDVWVTTTEWSAAIELKYFTRALEVVADGEAFTLLNQGGQDLGRYDFVKDVTRVEVVAQNFPRTRGYVVALTNDSTYWRVPTVQRPTIDSSFRLHEGARLFGDVGWASGAGGTTRGRERPHSLRGTYDLRWRDYSRVADGPAGTFRYLLVEAMP